MFLCNLAVFSYPKIQNLTNSDSFYKQYSNDVKINYEQLALAKKPEELVQYLSYYEYTVDAKMDLYSLSARCNIIQDTIATLNEITNKNESIKNKTLLLPTMRGLFIPVKQEQDNTLIILLQNDDRFKNRDKDKKGVLLPITNPNTKKREYYYFLPNEIFNSTERTFFLNVGFTFPLDKTAKYWLSSPFGKRNNPFTGHPSNHNGIDLAAPKGTPVLATQAGVVTFTGYSSIYGNYAVIKHNDVISSLYGHLDSIKIYLNEIVKTGTIIGTVGTTGMSTGNHLHFEILEGGKAKDPLRYLSGEVIK